MQPRARVKLPFCSFPTETTRRPVRDLSSSRAPIRERVGFAEHASAARLCDLTGVARSACVSPRLALLFPALPEAPSLVIAPDQVLKEHAFFTPPWQKGQ